MYETNTYVQLFDYILRLKRSLLCFSFWMPDTTYFLNDILQEMITVSLLSLCFPRLTVVLDNTLNNRLKSNRLES